MHSALSRGKHFWHDHSRDRIDLAPETDSISEERKRIAQSIEIVMLEKSLNQEQVAERLGVDSRSIRRYQKHEQTMSKQVNRKFQEEFGFAPEQPLEPIEPTEPIETTENEFAFAYRLGRHWLLKSRKGIAVVRADAFRQKRDFALLCCCSFNVLKVINVAGGKQFGLSIGYDDPMFLFSVILTVALGYAFCEDLFRGRYFKSADD